MDGRIQFVYATCGRRYFCIRIKKFADTKISGYVWTGPKPIALLQYLLVKFLNVLHASPTSVFIRSVK